MEIDKGAEKKLKRGLHDLSPLFPAISDAPDVPGGDAVSSRIAPVPHPLLDAQFLSVCVADHEGDAFLANAYVASQMVKRSNLFSFLISIAPGMNALPSKTADPFPTLELLDSKISRLRLSHQELWSFTKSGLSQPPRPSVEPAVSRPTDGFLVFLDFEPSQFRSLARVSLLLDRVVLFVQPEVESLREAYRLMKVFWQFNRDLEFFLLFREEDSVEAREAYLFERFSLITSRFLSLSPRWLGHLPFPERGRARGEAELNFRFQAESLLSPEGLRRPLSPEKARFWQSLRHLSKRHFHDESALPKP